MYDDQVRPSITDAFWAGTELPELGGRGASFFMQNKNGTPGLQKKKSNISKMDKVGKVGFDLPQDD